MPQYNGVWTLDAAAQAQSNQQWVTDPNFKNTTLLLQADNAANGAQNNTFLDSSSNAFAITRSGNTTQGSFTPFSQAPGWWSNFFTAASSQTISFANNAAFQFGAPSGNTNNFSIEYFVYPTTTAISQPVCTGYTSGTTYWSFGLNRTTAGTNTAGYVQFYLTDNFNVTATSGLVVNQWNHIAAVRTGTTVSLFVNGIRQATGTSSVDPNPTGSLYVGGDAAFLGRYIDGYVSNVRIVKGSTLPYDATQSSIIVPNLNLTAITGTTVLTSQSNRFVDNSSNALPVSTITGTPSVQPFSPFAPQYQWTPTVIGGSGYFNGSTDYLTVADNAAFDFGSGNFTIEAWVNPSSASGIKSICSKIYDFGPFLLVVSGTTFLYYLSSTGTSWNVASGVSGGTVPAGVWTHVALVRNGSTVTPYVNGVAGTATTTSATLISNTRVFSNGADQTSGSGFVQYFNGYMSNLRLVKGQALATGNFTPPTAPVTASTVGWTGANAASSLTGSVSFLTNYTNAGIYDGTMKNDLITVGNAQVSTTVVKYGSGSMYFDGTGDYLQLTASPNLALLAGDFTVEMWVYPLSYSAATNYPLWDTRASATSTNGYYFGLTQTTGYPLLYLYPSTILTGTIAPSLNTWSHIAYSRVNGTIRLFVNGVQAGSVANSNSISDPSANISRIGQSAVGGVENYTGYIDDFRITKGVGRYITNFIPPKVALPRQ